MEPPTWLECVAEAALVKAQRELGVRGLRLEWHDRHPQRVGVRAWTAPYRDPITVHLVIGELKKRTPRQVEATVFHEAYHLARAATGMDSFDPRQEETKAQEFVYWALGVLGD